MADNKEYRTITGFIQFDPEYRDVDSLNLTVRDFTVRNAGAEGDLIRVTVFPEFDDAEFERGDFVAIDGPFDKRIAQSKGGDKREYLNLRASRVFLNGELVVPAERKVEKRTKGKL